MNRQEFINTISGMCRDPDILPCISIAQAILESGWGKSGLTLKANALFGIKAGKSWQGKTYNAKTQECYNGQDFVNTTAFFRAYECWQDSVDDHSRLLHNERYKAVIGEKDYKKAAYAIYNAGYATDPAYPEKIINIIESYNLYEEETQMSIKKYSLAKDGETSLSQNFKVKEFRCKGGDDEILIDIRLPTLLEKIRAYFNKPVRLTSAYRDPKYNASIGGAKKSQHMLGTAVDVRIDGVKPREVAIYAESLGLGGIGLYEYDDPSNIGFTHVDVRPGKARWLQTKKNGGAKSVSGFGIAPSSGKTKIWLGCEGEEVKALQRKLGVPDDGKFGKATETAVKEFQVANGLEADGVVGAKTGTALKL